MNWYYIIAAILGVSGINVVTFIAFVYRRGREDEGLRKDIEHLTSVVESLRTEITPLRELPTRVAVIEERVHLRR